MIEVAGALDRHRQARVGHSRGNGQPAAKLERYRQHGIPVVLGGTLTEVAISQDRLEQLIAWVHELGLRHFEISDGTITLEHARKLELIERLARRVHRALRGGLQGRHGRDHAPLPVGRADAHRARGGGLEGHRRGPRGGHGGHIPSDRRGARGIDRGDRARDRAAPASCSTRPRSTSRSGSCSASGPRSTSATSPPMTYSAVETLRLGLRSDTLGIGR